MEFKDSYFTKTLKLIKSNPRNILNIVLFDILFLAAVIIFYGLVGSLLSKPSPAISTTVLITYLALALLYYPILILIYSFFKYIVLDSITSLFKKTSLNFGRLKKFSMLNLSIFVVFFITFLVLNGVFLMGAKEGYTPYIFLAINTPLFLLTYIIINISHTLFSEYEKSGIKETIKKTFSIIAKVRSYIGIFLMDAAVIFIYFVVFYLIGVMLKATALQDYAAQVKYSNIYTLIFAILTSIFFYLVIVFNRIYFYNIIKSKK